MKVLIEIVIIVFSALADFYLLLGAVRYVLSGGDASSIVKAKNQILWAFLLLTLLVCLSFLVFFLIPPIAVDSLSITSLLLPLILPFLLVGLAVVASISEAISRKDRITSLDTPMASSPSATVPNELESEKGTSHTSEELQQPPKQPTSSRGNRHTSPLILVYNIHSSLVLTVSWAPDGTRIASAGRDGVVRVWDADTGNSSLTYRNSLTQVSNFILSPTVYIAEWSPDGTRIASAGDGTVVNVWDAMTGRNIRTYQGHSGLSGMIYALSWSPDGKHIASACSAIAGTDKTVHIWEVATGETILRCDTSPGLRPIISVLAVDWSPDGAYVAACEDRIIRVWHAVSGQLMQIYRSHSGVISNIAWSPDSTLLAAANSNHTVQIWDTRTAKSNSIYYGHTGSVRDVAWSPDGAQIASASNDKTVHVWNPTTGQLIFQYKGHSDMVTAIAWSPDGKRIASASNDETVQVWQLDQSRSEVSDATQSRIDPSDSIESFFKQPAPREYASVFHLRLVEEPLTPATLISLLSAMTDLVTKCWLIGQGRFADLIEYTQTHDRRFVEETQLAFTRITYNSPFEASFKVDLSAPSVAEGIKVAIDAITQIKHRVERAELENKEKAQELENVKQRAQQEHESVLLEKERQQLAIERERLEILEKRLDVQKKGIVYALEIAAQMVMVLHPGSDEQTKAMLMQALLPTILQLQNGKNLELSFPTLQIGGEEAEQDE